MNLVDLNNEKLVELYSSTIKELKKRNIIWTKNVTGDLAEYLAIQHYFVKHLDCQIFRLHLLALKMLMRLVELEIATA